jgi:hypothetical protein
MHKEILALFMVVISVLALGCEKKSNAAITEPPVPSDTGLARRIIGGWYSAGFSIFFNEDGTYLDSTFASVPPDSIIRRNLRKVDGRSLIRVSGGLYTIDQDIIMRQPTECQIDYYPLHPPGCYLYYDEVAELSNDTLRLTPFFTWHRLSGTTKGIWANWQTRYWAWSYHSQLPVQGAPQLITEFVSFDSGSSTYKDSLIGLPYDGTIWHRSFNYVPPLLSRTDDYTSFIVSFENTEMYWNQTRTTRSYLRIK